MKAVIFCGGPGTRLWPISRRKSPKQLEKIFDTRSTAELAYERIEPLFGAENIYIATSSSYEAQIKEMFPALPVNNIFLEPAVRDLGPAVGNVVFKISISNPTEPVFIMWSDHLIENVTAFQKMIKKAEQLILDNSAKIVYFAQVPVYPNQNLGWIELGEVVDGSEGVKLSKFANWTYRPSLEQAIMWFKNHSRVWNMGYFMTTPAYLVEAYGKHAASLTEGLNKIAAGDADVLNAVYPTLPKISFDDAVVVHLPKEDAVVLSADIGWSDPGALDAMKKMLEAAPGETVTKGKVVARNAEDCFIYNATDNLVASVGVKDLIIIATEDVFLVCHKDQVPQVKKLVEGLEGTVMEGYI